VLIADYYLIRRTRLDLDGLYAQRGPYWYRGGFNLWAIVALGVGIGLCLPGFLDKLGYVVPDVWAHLYNYAWFVSFAAAFVVYFMLMKCCGQNTNPKR
jgi:NCS1 family nucleobase:cation symporter-1